MIKILIVDDSTTETSIIQNLVSSEKDFIIVGTAKNGKEAIRLTKLLKPDLITMDIQMPEMNGIEATKFIMSQYPTPIVIISSNLNNKNSNMTFEAFDAGAISVLEKPVNIFSPEFQNEKRKIIDTLRNMAGIKVIKRRFHSKKIVSPNLSTPSINLSKEYEVIVIGSSIGGPQALKSILGKLPADFPIPIVIVQHMTKGFINNFAQWLDNNILLQVKTPKENEVLKSGTVYFAPDNCHLEISRRQNKLIAKLTHSEPVSGFSPSITVLFQSAAKICGKNAIGILLTGMGNDGAKGMLDLKHANAHTLIQDKESAVVFGMAGVALSLGAVDEIVQLDQIADYLQEIIDHKGVV